MRLDLVLEPDSPQRFAELGLLAESLGFGAVWTANHIAARDPFMSFMALTYAFSDKWIGRIGRIGLGWLTLEADIIRLDGSQWRHLEWFGRNKVQGFQKHRL
jgi:hypothetical protein